MTRRFWVALAFTVPLFAIDDGSLPARHSIAG